MSHVEKEIILRIECSLKSFYCKRKFSIYEWTLKRFRSYLARLLSLSYDNVIIVLHSKTLTIDHDNLLLNEIDQLNSEDTIIVHSSLTKEDIDRSTEKYRMTDQKYNQRKGTLREYLKINQLGKYNQKNRSFFQKICQDKLKLQELNRIKMKQIHIGMYVQVNEPIAKIRYGVVVYIGMLVGIHDEFIGVIFNSPCGDSNGFDGLIQYFDAKPKHASFVRPEYVQIVTNKN